MRTARLEVRPVVESDRPRMVDLLSDPSFMVFSEHGPLSDTDANRRFDRMLGLAAEVPFCKQAIVDSSGTIVGYAGADYFDLRGERRLEFGYRLIESARGRGYATEASAALLHLAADTFTGELLAFIDPANHPSRRVLRKLGFEFAENLTLGYDIELYRMVF